ncbi:MAG: hypothetical protein G01um101431_701 [Parcubacteria group bacterium Gr01-1014_31]|nr:MAG: hypothetical protein G01um101431_701 [Parcubacteria group bacterium Gr01-1014_31]
MPQGCSAAREWPFLLPVNFGCGARASLVENLQHPFFPILFWTPRLVSQSGDDNDKTPRPRGFIVVLGTGLLQAGAFCLRLVAARAFGLAMIGAATVRWLGLGKFLAARIAFEAVGTAVAFGADEVVHSFLIIRICPRRGQAPLAADGFGVYHRRYHPRAKTRAFSRLLIL